MAKLLAPTRFWGGIFLCSMAGSVCTTTPSPSFGAPSARTASTPSPAFGSRECSLLSANLSLPVRLTTSVELTWWTTPFSTFETVAHLCVQPGPGGAHCDTPQGTLSDSGVLSAAATSAPCKLTLYIGVPFGELEDQRTAAAITGTIERVAACSDSVDNDGDGLKDLADPSCTNLASDDELPAVGSTSAAAEHNFAWDLQEDDVGGAFLGSLTWNGAKVIQDTGNPAERYYFHGSTGPFVSNWQAYKWTERAWHPNTFWNQTTCPIKSETAPVKSTVVRNGSDFFSLMSVGAFMEVQTTYRFVGDAVRVGFNVTNTMPTGATLYFPLVWGNLQIGSTSAGCSCPIDLKKPWCEEPDSATITYSSVNCSDSCKTGLWHLDGLRQGSIQRGQPYSGGPKGGGGAFEPDVSKLPGWRETNAHWDNIYPLSSYYSPVTALGANHGAWSVGIQVLSPSIHPDSNTSAVEFFDIPAAASHPLLSQYFHAVLHPQAQMSFAVVAQFSSAGGGGWSREANQAVLSDILTPYTDYFRQTFGSRHLNCPVGTQVYGWGSSNGMYNQTSQSYRPGASLYRDVLRVDDAVEILPKAGATVYTIWQGQIFSSHLITGGYPYEFNPNSEVLDPNLDAACNESVWHNATETLGRHGIRLAWFGRPCSDIVAPDGTPARLICGKSKGDPWKLVTGAVTGAEMPSLSNAELGESHCRPHHSSKLKRRSTTVSSGFVS